MNLKRIFNYYKMSKSLYLIRHGYSLHNELFQKMGTDAFRIPEVIDSPLTTLGQTQALDLGKRWTEKDNIELVLVSPLTRALETAVNVFDSHTPIICQEFLREYPIGEDTCNQRSDTNLLIKNFPTVNFSDIHLKKDTLWSEKRETIEELEKRIQQMVDYLRNRPESKIAIVCHSSYLGQFKDKKIGYIENGEKDLQHCFPYEYTLKI